MTDKIKIVEPSAKPRALMIATVITFVKTSLKKPSGMANLFN